MLFYRRDLLKQAGFDEPPETWDEWLAAMRKIKRDAGQRTEIAAADGGGRSFRVGSQPDRYALLIPTNEWEQPTIFALQTGAQMSRDDGQYGELSRAPSSVGRSSFT